MRAFVWVTLWLVCLSPSVGAAHGFIPFESGPKHPFVGEAAHVPGQGPAIVLPKPVNAPSLNSVKGGIQPTVVLQSALFGRTFLP